MASAEAYLIPLVRPTHDFQDNIGPQTVTRFFDAAVTYGIPTLRQECFSWLLKNLMTSSPEFLAGISKALMAELVDNADLFVMQVRVCLENEKIVIKQRKKKLILQTVDWRCYVVAAR